MAYVDNPMNRRLGRVGKPYGSHVVHNDGTMTILEEQHSVTSQLQAYVDNPMNRRLGRVGQPYGSHVVHNDGTMTIPEQQHSVTSQLQAYVDNPMNRRLGRVGKPNGSHVVHNDGTMTILEQQHSVTSQLQGAILYSRVYYSDTSINRQKGLAGKLIRTYYYVPHTEKDTSPPESGTQQSSPTAALPDSSGSDSSGTHTTQESQIASTGGSTQPDSSTQDSQDHGASGTDGATLPVVSVKKENVKHESHGATNYSQSQEDRAAAGDVHRHPTGYIMDDKCKFVIPSEEVSISQQELSPQGSVEKIYSGRWLGMKIAFLKFNVTNKPTKWTTKLRREIQVLCQLVHPNVVRLYGGVYHRTCGVVMEWIPCNLHQAVFIQDRPLDEEEKTGIVRQISEGVSFLHSRNIVHCNLTSKEIFLTEYNIAKVGGYGPKFQTSNVESIYDLVRQVDPCYAAPEIIRKDLLTLEQLKKSDIYSLAVIVYEVQEMKRSCDGLTTRQLEAIRCSVNLGTVLRAVKMTQSIFNILCKCWEVSLDERPTATEFIRMWND